ncbi:PAS domain-containing sensor histidine kinase [Halalkalibacter nanhaiisediminis]|uniref:histidine kinase n=1 Tax=Halalkalibacter nanhaiisediminis TaxID=688079 RepID=A0A562QRF1_9BACI|nr:PAS domain-containing sensor histidine kinase [Halalkalibacter nanhaiisediminis]TWI59332.1 hypothetical protein IQ10_01048 [Halalkalibacter nanhaiisediminis]
MAFLNNEETISILNTIGENIFITDTNYNIVWINDYAEGLIKKIGEFINIYSKDELIGKNISSFHPENGKKQMKILKEGPFPYESTINLFNRFTANLVINRLIIAGELKGYILTWKDVTEYEQKVTDTLLALDESTMVVFTDTSGRMTFANNKFCEITKYRKKELIGRNIRMLNSNYHSENFFKELWQTITKGEKWSGVIRNKAKDGSFYWVQTTIVPFLNQKGEAYQFASIRTEVSHHKKTEEKLKKTLDELSHIKYALDKSSFLAILDRHFRYSFVNDAFCELTKFRREELIGKNHDILDSDYHSPDFYPKIFEKIERGMVWRGEIKKRAKDGSTFWVDTTIVPYFKEDKLQPYQYVTIQQDITSRKEAEEVLQRSEKLAAIGELAAGVAHEIRNPLTTIKGFSQIGFENQVYKNVVLDEIERINFIVNELMVLAKPHAITFSKRDIISIIKYIISMLSSESNLKNVQFIFQPEVEEIIVKCEENQLKQVFLNLFKNGMEAMPNGGKIHVNIHKEKNDVHITVRDEGIGIPPDKIKKLGEPFFTMKKEGNGLGLMVSYKIIENHRGTIKVESQLNHGTTFTVILAIEASH